MRNWIFSLMVRGISVLMLSWPIVSLADRNLADLHAQPVVTTDNPMGYRMALPLGAGPFPTVMFANNCGGYDMPDIAKGYHRHTARLVKLGYAVVWNEHFKTHKLKNCVDINYNLWSDSIIQTAGWVKDQSWSEKKRLYLIAFSAGANAASISLSSAGIEPSIFTKVVLMYPACASNSFATWKTPTQVRYFVGTKEFGNTDSRRCSLSLSQMDKTHFTQRFFKDAYHAFELYEEGSRAIDGDSNGSPSALAAIDWWSDVMEFIGR